MESIDWSKFKGEPENTVYCRCAVIYRSHTKLVATANGFEHHSELPCPNCGKSVNNMLRVSSDPELQILRSK